MVIFTLFYSHLDLRSSECDVVCYVFDSVCELFGETIRNVFGCSCYFVVECNGSV